MEKPAEGSTVCVLYVYINIALKYSEHVLLASLWKERKKNSSNTFYSRVLLLQLVSVFVTRRSVSRGRRGREREPVSSRAGEDNQGGEQTRSHEG